MAKLTAITVQEKNKKRCNLFIDDNFFAGISIETVLLNRLKVGQEVSLEELGRIVNESQQKEAIEKAVSYVNKGLKTKKQVFTYLTKKGYTKQICWQCIDKLKEYNLINDTEYSRRFIDSASKTQGKRLIEYKLMMKGVKKEEIASAYDDCDISSKENAKNVAIKHFKSKEITKENVAKTFRYLIGRGFSYEDANYAVSFIKNGEEWNEF